MQLHCFIHPHLKIPVQLIIGLNNKFIHTLPLRLRSSTNQMKPTIGKRAASNIRQEEKKTSAARLFVEINTHHNITLKRQFIYIENVKETININIEAKTLSHLRIFDS